ncbi:hypothetical protein HD806DRAFT_544927 [Xylariaceae sp. AK1471]|nr:hypothetical protein HD806DRAFT_544927 [Xylariaceae sp. AK1471]
MKIDFDIVCDDTTQYISVQEVEKATALVKEGIQKLRHVSSEHTTLFYVALPLPNGHIAATEIRTVPLLNPPSRNPSFLVWVRYVPCHQVEGEASSDELQWLCRHVQEVYNTYIVAVRWDFGHDWYGTTLLVRSTLTYISCERCSVPESGNTCHQIAQWGFEWLAGRQTIDKPTVALDYNRRDGSENEQNDTTQVRDNRRNLQLTVRDVHPNPKRRRGHSTVQTLSGNQTRRSGTHSTETIANTLISKAKSGMTKYVKREKHTVLQSREGIRELEKKCLELREDHQRLHDTLIQLETKFLQMARKTTVDMRLAAWTNWLYSSSLRQILYMMGVSTRNRRACAVHILYSIVNHLLPTEGVNALAVVLAFGGKREVQAILHKLTSVVHCHTLTEASDKGPEDQGRISQMVANGLRGSLIPLPDDCELFIPAAWISKVANINIRNAYVSLGMPNLSVLGLDPNCSPTDAEKSVTIKQIRNAWSAFEHDVNGKLVILRKALELCKAGSFEELNQLVHSSSLRDSADFSYLRQQIVTVSSEHMNTLAKRTYGIIAIEFGQIVGSWLDQRAQSAIVTQQNSPSSSLNVLLEAARHADTAAVQMPTNAFLRSHGNTQISRDDTEDTNWMEWIDPDVCNFGNVPLTSMFSHNGGLP